MTKRRSLTQKTGRKDNKVWEGPVNVLQAVMMSSVFFVLWKGFIWFKTKSDWEENTGKKMATTKIRGL